MLHVLDVRALRSIPTPVADALLARGCRTAGDVLAHPKVLQQALDELRVADAEKRAGDMIAACARETAPGASGIWASADSALQLLQQGQAVPPVVLPCRQLGGLLGNALRPGSGILEVCGLPGSGKTQLCLQICAAAQIPLPPQHGGPPAEQRPVEAIYVDAEGSFVARRYAQVCGSLLAERRPGADGAAEMEAVLRGMHVCRTYDAAELYSTLKQLACFLQGRRGAVRAIVVDSLAFCFRHEFAGDQPLRARILMDIATLLRRYSAEHRLVVAVTNHMTTRFDRGGPANGDGWLAPALGETWAHQPSTQIRLERLASRHLLAHAAAAGATWGGGAAAGAAADSATYGGGTLDRPLGRATLTKSAQQAAGQACLFRIVEAGIRDAEGPGL